jgi:type IV secretion system protein TrbL
MGNLNVIDQFTDTFIRFIDSGFGLLQGDVAALTSVLVGIDITLAGLFWVLDGEANVFAHLLKKVLYVGTFAFILNNFAFLADVVFRSFSTLGLNATANALTAQDLLRPGHLAGIGFQAAWPLMQQAGSLVGFTNIINHGVLIFVLVVAWLIVILAFFILAVQLFVTLIEFKLTSLAGFVLVPFALWNKTAFLAERVLGNVVTSGVKVMVLAVIVGIGSSFFGQFINALQGQEPSLADALSLVLASMALFGLGIFGPSIAAGLISGAPQLGAGAVVGTGGALIAGTALAGAGVAGVARLAGSGGLAAIRAGAALGSGTATAYRIGQATSDAQGLARIGAGLGGVARAAAGAGAETGSAAFRPIQQAANEGAEAGWKAARRLSGVEPASPSMTSGPSASAGDFEGAPAWARRLRAEQRRRIHANTVIQAIKAGDKPASGAAPDLKQEP